MIIYKCDLCKKTIKEKDQKKAIFAGNGVSFGKAILCEECGKPVRKFLVKKKLIERV